MKKYHLTRKSTTEKIEQFEVFAQSREEAIKLAYDYDKDITGTIKEVSGGYEDGDVEVELWR